MNEPITITATLRDWTSNDYSTRRLLDWLQEGNSQEAAECMIFSNSDMDKGSSPWTQVGEAQVTVSIFSRNELMQRELATLKAELDAARAEWLTKQRQIMDRISKLQALTNEVDAREGQREVA